MKNTHEEGGTRMQRMVLAALENLKKDFSHRRCHRCICTVMFSVPDSQAKHCCGKVITSEREVCHDRCRETMGNK